MNELLLTNLAFNSDFDPEVLLFLVTLPLVITILGFTKYILGFKSFGLYVPVIITYLFYQFSLINTTTTSIFQGLKYGLFVILIVFLSSYLSYKIIRPLTLHYYSKLAIVTSTVTLTLLLILFILSVIGKGGILKIDIFSLILIVSISERFMNLLASKQTKLALYLSLQTILLGILCFLIISSQSLQVTFLKYPWLILFSFPINYIIGRFTGLRITEYFRFKDILKQDPES